MIVLGLFAVLLAPPQTSPQLVADGPWQVEKMENGCRASRAFTGDTPVVLGFETYLTTTSTTMLVSAPKGMLPDQGPGSIRLSVSPGQAAEVHYGAFAVADPKARLIKLFPDRATIAAIAIADTVEIGATPIRIPAKGAGDAIRAMNDCTAAILAGWGVDPQPWRDGKLAGFAGQPQGWFTNDDARRILPSGVKSARVVLLVTTTPQGAPASCRAVQSTDQRLDARLCDLAMKRSTFRAPIGTDGKPMASYVTMPVGLSR